jgi:hypothetical protein
MAPRNDVVSSRPPTKRGQVFLFLLEVLRPLFLLLGFLFRMLWIVAFSWWANPLLDHWMQSSFASEIRQAMPFLFDQYAGRVVPDPWSAANDPNQSYVAIGSRSVIFKFSKWRSENYEVIVSPVSSPAEFYDLWEALRAADPSGNPVPPPASESWFHFGQVLEPRFQLLEEAFKEENFPMTKEKLSRLRLQPR